uniref:Uncharacterized protein n=1 Tax=Avena sativa TaxID=4498 RepID=A0ACD5WRS6_AVESA
MRTRARRRRTTSSRYEAALGMGVMTNKNGEKFVPNMAQVVHKKFWDFYTVEEEFEEKSNEVFDRMARDKVYQMIHDARKTCISHYFAEQGERKLKDKIVKEKIEDDFKVENYLMCVPKWCYGKKAAWAALVDMWTSDPEFYARSLPSKKNCGNGGTHVQGNMTFDRFKDHKDAHKKKDPKPNEDPYYGSTSETMSNYSSRFIELYGPDSQPLQEPVDETAVMLAGCSRPHGRLKILNAVPPSTTTLTRIKATTGKVDSILPRAPRRDPRYEDAYDEVCHEFHRKMKEWHDAIDAREEHLQAAHKAWYMAMVNNTPVPPYVDPPPKPPMPFLSSKAEFLEYLATGTPGSSHSQTHFGCATASPLESPETTPLHQGGPSPGHSGHGSRPHSPTP